MEEYTNTTEFEELKPKDESYTDDMQVDLEETLCTFFKDAQDPMGSYTGTSLWGDAYPEQDVDDL